MINVAVCGHFDPLHPGHVSHISEAAKLGDRLTVIVMPDSIVAQKRLKNVGRPLVFQPLDERIAVIRRECPWVDDVVVATDTDGTVAKTLETLKPDILAKGGDRTPETMPAGELATCARIGCRIVYGVGEPKRPGWSSTEIALAAVK